LFPGLKNLEFWRNPLDPAVADTQGTPPTRLVAEPERTNQWYLDPASGRLTMHRARPHIGDGPSAGGVQRVELREFAFGGLSDLLAYSPQLVRKLWPLPWKFLEQNLEDQTRDRIQV